MGFKFWIPLSWLEDSRVVTAEDNITNLNQVITIAIQPDYKENRSTLDFSWVQAGNRLFSSILAIKCMFTRPIFLESSFWEKQIFSSGFSLKTSETARTSRFDKRYTRNMNHRHVQEDPPKTVADNNGQWEGQRCVPSAHHQQDLLHKLILIRASRACTHYHRSLCYLKGIESNWKEDTCLESVPCQLRFRCERGSGEYVTHMCLCLPKTS